MKCWFLIVPTVVISNEAISLRNWYDPCRHIRRLRDSIKAQWTETRESKRNDFENHGQQKLHDDLVDFLNKKLNKPSVNKKRSNMGNETNNDSARNSKNNDDDQGNDGYDDKKKKKNQNKSGNRDRKRSSKNKVNIGRSRIVAVECSETPLLFCSLCDSDIVHKEQNYVISKVISLYPQSTVVETAQKLINVIFFRIIQTDDDSSVDNNSLLEIQGVKRVFPHNYYRLDLASTTNYIGASYVHYKFCRTGKHVRVAVLDTGVDYMHKDLGGPGTVEAYQSAYGTTPESMENTQRDAHFPTQRVVDGYDVLGETFVATPSNASFVNATPDLDPIDRHGHGTIVAATIVAVAPDVQLVAVKVCDSLGTACPEFAVIKGLEYILDLNNDTSTDDKVNVVNLSMGYPFLSSYYDLTSEMVSRLYMLGITTIVSCGNRGNIPYALGGAAAAPFVITTGATGYPRGSSRGVVASYSSRGPGDNNIIKPDIVAPGGSTVAMAGTGTLRHEAVDGTSFAAPVVTGAVALLKERCPECSPLSIKALLMNNAKYSLRYSLQSRELAPVSLIGAGEVRIYNSLDAEFWAYCEQDKQPSLSLGLVNAASTIYMHRTIKVINLSSRHQSLTIRNIFTGPNVASTGVLGITFSPSWQVLEGTDCNNEVIFNVTFQINATIAPPNFMTSGGKRGDLPDETLDHNEFGGYIIIQSDETSKKISLPFHAIIRQAANVTIANTIIRNNESVSSSSPSLTSSSASSSSSFENSTKTVVLVNLTNHGEGVAQVDSFQLLTVSEDEIENGLGGIHAPSDFRSIGYRIIVVDKPHCSYLLEFVITTWERKRRLMHDFFEVAVDINLDNEPEYILFNSGDDKYGPPVECLIQNVTTGTIHCTGFPPDHGTNTAVTILRACSEDLGLLPTSSSSSLLPSSSWQGSATTTLGVQEGIVLNVAFTTYTVSASGRSKSTTSPYLPIEFPVASLSGPSYDIKKGETLRYLVLDGTNYGTTTTRTDGGSVPDSNSSRSIHPMGMILTTNAYRRPNSTGASLPETEAILLLTRGVPNHQVVENDDDGLLSYHHVISSSIPMEMTPDVLVFPQSNDIQGPLCVWNDKDNETCDTGVMDSTAPTGTLLPTTPPTLLPSGGTMGLLASVTTTPTLVVVPTTRTTTTTRTAGTMLRPTISTTTLSSKSPDSSGSSGSSGSDGDSLLLESMSQLSTIENSTVSFSFCPPIRVPRAVVETVSPPKSTSDDSTTTEVVFVAVVSHTSKPTTTTTTTTTLEHKETSFSFPKSHPAAGPPTIRPAIEPVSSTRPSILLPPRPSIGTTITITKGQETETNNNAAKPTITTTEIASTVSPIPYPDGVPDKSSSHLFTVSFPLLIPLSGFGFMFF